MADEKQEPSGSWLSTIKWVCIAITALVFGFFAYKVYRMVAAPAQVVGDAAEGVTNAVKSGASAVKETTSGVYNRLYIPAPHQKKLNKSAEAAFNILTKVPATEAAGVKDGMMRMRHLGGSAGRVCAVQMNFGAGDIPIHVAADNEAYATSKSLGSPDDRLIRMVLVTENDDVAFNTGWDSESKSWQMKWKATTVKKEISDAVAAKRIMDILRAVKSKCRS